VSFPEGDQEQIRAWLDRTKGRLLAEVRLRAGDMLYVPRGWYHDALASSSAALHVTFSVAPPTGRLLFRLLEKEAMGESDFRAYLPEAGSDGGAALRERVAALSGRIGEILRSEAFLTQVRHAQAELKPRADSYETPRTMPLTVYEAADTGRVVREPDGWVLLTDRGRTPAGEGHEALAWVVGRPAFAVEELRARFPQLSEAVIADTVFKAAQAGVIRRH
jgi:ribosomal protein L16 Arg81 hydroxylase